MRSMHENCLVTRDAELVEAIQDALAKTVPRRDDVNLVFRRVHVKASVEIVADFRTAFERCVTDRHRCVHTEQRTYLAVI
jgi:hypothetical protein